MAVYFDVSSRKNISLEDGAIETLLGDGNDSEIEELADLEEAGDFDLNNINIQPLSLETVLPSTSQSHPERIIPRRSKKRKLAVIKKPRKRIWKQTSFVERDHTYPNLPVVPVRLPMEYFDDYFDSNFFETMAECSNSYYHRTTGKLLKTNEGEQRKLIGIHFIMGCIPYPRLEMYWRQGIKLDIIVNAMSRERFKILRTALHLVNEDVAPVGIKNSLWKVQPIIDRVKFTCQNIERVPGYYSIDEQMIPFTGRCAPGLRQVVKNKPRPVGLKNFVMTTKEGLMLDFEIYQGANTSFSDKTLGLGPSVVTHLSKSIPPGSCIYFDRYFTTIRLIDHLKTKKLHGTGTLMFNRLAERNSMKFKKDSRMLRGESQQFVSGNVAVVKWKDNKSVLITSNCTGNDTLQEVSRWDKLQRSYIPVTAPKVISNYNKFMGGVDVLDQMIEYYRSFIKTRKWTLKVIIHFFDLSVVNGWRLYKNQCERAQVPKNKIMDLLAFKMQVAQGLIATPDRKRATNCESDEDEHFHERLPSGPSRRYRPAIAPVLSKRFDGYDHLPLFDEIESPRCCRYEGCKSRSKIRCEKCNVYLCLSRNKTCFKLYHKREN